MKGSIKIKKEAPFFSLVLPTTDYFLIYNPSQTSPSFMMAVDQK